jgi:hypothetical protein
MFIQKDELQPIELAYSRLLSVTDVPDECKQAMITAAFFRSMQQI